MTISRKWLLASVALAFVGSPAFAADLLPTKKAPPAPTMSAPYSWTGFSVGVNGGYGWGAESDGLAALTGYPLDSFNSSGAIGGGHIAYNYQFMNSFVVGASGEFDGSGLQGSKSASSLGAEGTVVSSLSMKNTWQAFVLGRAGFAFDRLLVYGTGGLAIADDKESYYVNDPENGFWAGSQTKTLFGWALGVGAEYAFSDHWSLGGEVRYADFGKASFGIPASLSLSGTSTSYKAGFSETIAQVSLSYHF